jgi:hypothetical protein
MKTNFTQSQLDALSAAIAQGDGAYMYHFKLSTSLLDTTHFLDLAVVNVVNVVNVVKVKSSESWK